MVLRYSMLLGDMIAVIIVAQLNGGGGDRTPVPIRTLLEIGQKQIMCVFNCGKGLMSLRFDHFDK